MKTPAHQRPARRCLHFCGRPECAPGNTHCREVEPPTTLRERLRAIAGLGVSGRPRCYAARLPDYWQAKLEYSREAQRKSAQKKQKGKGA